MSRRTSMLAGMAVASAMSLFNGSNSINPQHEAEIKQNKKNKAKSKKKQVKASRKKNRR